MSVKLPSLILDSLNLVNLDRDHLAFLCGLCLDPFDPDLMAVAVDFRLGEEISGETHRRFALAMREHCFQVPAVLTQLLNDELSGVFQTRFRGTLNAHT